MIALRFPLPSGHTHNQIVYENKLIFFAFSSMKICYKFRFLMEFLYEIFFFIKTKINSVWLVGFRFQFGLFWLPFDDE